MLISHISDIHLGYAQFNLAEREQDIYCAFEEAVDKSIAEHADLVLLAGDIFHTPRPSGSSIVKLANELKKLREASVPVYFILGEHDISRIRDTPVPYLFENIRLARRLKDNQPRREGKLTLFGFNKERRSNMESMIQKFQVTQQLALQHKDTYNSKNILVLHQGLVEFNKFAGELNARDLPKGFDYYAMGHYHDHLDEKLNNLTGGEASGLIAYPGSLELTPSDGLKDVEKGFCLTDMSAQEPRVDWIKLEHRRQILSKNMHYESIQYELPALIKNAESLKRKPIVVLKILGEKINPKVVSTSLIKLNDSCLHYVWHQAESPDSAPAIYDGTPMDIEAELYKLTKETLGSDELAALAIEEILPAASTGDSRHTLDILWKLYCNSKKNKMFSFPSYNVSRSRIA
jgi:DNA repair protein SbcD/Mre11